MSYIPMSGSAAGDTTYGFASLSLKSEPFNDPSEFRLFHRSSDEDDTEAGSGNGGGSFGQHHHGHLGHSNPSYASNDAQYGQRSFQRGQGSMYGGELSMPRTESPIEHAPEMSMRYSSHSYVSPPFENTVNPAYLSGHQQELPLPDTTWDTVRSTTSYHDPYRGYSPASSNSSSGSLRASHEVQEYDYRRESNYHRETEHYLRRVHNIHTGPVNLDALPDPRPGERPSAKLATLAQLAIWGSRDKCLSLQGMYAAIEQRYEWYRSSGDRKWQGSIRHMLSLKGMFKNVPRPITEPGKGKLWMLDITQLEDKRERKRRGRGQGRGEDRSNESQEEADEDEDEGPTSPTESQDNRPSSRTGMRSGAGYGRRRTAPYTPSTWPPSSRQLPSRPVSGLHPSSHRSVQPQLSSLAPSSDVSLYTGALEGMNMTQIDPPPVQSRHNLLYSSPYRQSAYDSQPRYTDYYRPSFPMPPPQTSLTPHQNPPTYGPLGGDFSSGSSSSTVRPSAPTPHIRTRVTPNATPPPAERSLRSRSDHKGKGRAV